MKILVLALSLLFVSCSTSNYHLNKNEDVYIIMPGKGTNQLHIGTSKITSAFSLLGKNDKSGKKIIDGLDSAWAVYNYEYTKLGLKIIGSTINESKGEDLGNSIIESIYFTAPAKAKTNNGVTLNKSTLEEVKKIFGEPDVQDGYADVTILHYRKKGISFIIEKAINSVTGIEVYKENGYSSL